MRPILFVLVAGVAVVGAGWWLAGLPGQVSIELAGLTIETATPLAIAALALALFLVLLAFRLLLGLSHAGRGMRRWRRRRRRDLGDASLTRALVAIAAGEATPARRAAARARRLLGDGPQPLLLAAEAERLAGDETAAAALYRRLAERPDAALLGLRGLFRQALAREDLAEASAIAGRAAAAYPGGQWLREEREHLAARTGDWRQALALAPADSAARADYAAAAAAAEADPAEGERLARKAVAAFPGFAPAALVHAARLRAAGREERARDVLARAWTAAAQPDLATAALAGLADALARLKAGARLVAGRPDDAESHLLLARLNLDAGLMGEARRHLAAARAQGAPDRRFWLLLADLEGAERGETETGRLAQREALRHAARAPAEPDWRCEACGAALPQWQAACPRCHAPARIRWGARPRALAAPDASRLE